MVIRAGNILIDPSIIVLFRFQAEKGSISGGECTLSLRSDPGGKLLRLERDAADAVNTYLAKENGFRKLHTVIFPEHRLLYATRVDRKATLYLRGYDETPIEFVFDGQGNNEVEEANAYMLVPTNQ